MKYTLDKPMVLYHAVSSYQLLEVMLHRMVYHPMEKAVLLLPDFIVGKYPQYRKLARRKFFDEVYLFPYLHIPHREEREILEDTARYYRQIVPHPVTAFQKVYVAGAHFYFSLYLIEQRVPFSFFEDAAGMLSRAQELYDALLVKFPIHAKIAQKYGLFDGSNPWVREIICLKHAQTKENFADRTIDFSVENTLDGLSEPIRRKVIRFFRTGKLRTRADAVLLTQHFANLGMMGEEEQSRMYERLRDDLLRDVRLVIKKHPDDTLDYRRIFPKAEQIRAVFPSELLPYVFVRKPEKLYTFDSTGCENLRGHFMIYQIGREYYAKP